VQHVAHIYGLRVRSCWPLPSASSLRLPLKDVEFQQSSVAALRSHFDSANTQQWSNWVRFARHENNAYSVSWGRLLHALISADGARVELASASPAAADSLQSYLFTQVLSFSLLRSGVDPLHGTVVSVPAGSFALLGDSGVGKSTLTAALLHAGAQLISDDMLAIVPDGNLGVLAGPARLRMLPATARRLLPGDLASVRLNPYTTKRAYELPANWHDSNPPALRAIYVLQRGDRHQPLLRIEELRPADLMCLLLRHTFNPLDSSASRLRSQLDLYRQLVEAVPIRVVRIQRQIIRLAEAAALLLGDFAGCAPPKS
jgi:hypothetical protein